jgi:hypothetical protein
LTLNPIFISFEVRASTFRLLLVPKLGIIQAIFVGQVRILTFLAI